MIKIAMVMTSLDTGGIATSIKNLLYEISDSQEYELDLILFHVTGDERSMLPENVKIIYAGKLPELTSISQKNSRKLGLRYYIMALLSRMICKLFGHGLAYRVVFGCSRKFGGYDIAISCTQSAPYHRFYGGCNEFVLRNIAAKGKIAFIHCDYVSYGLNDTYSRRIYGKYDRIAAVSDSVRRVFLNAEPQFADKTYTVLNCNNIPRILKEAEERPVIYEQDRVSFVTVARVGAEKGHVRVLKGLGIAKQKGARFSWYVVGGSKADAPVELLEKARKLGVYENMVFCGEQRNPYRYMRNADFILVPSYHEAAPMVFHEAFILGVPVLTTDTVSAKEMVLNNGYGIVCENTDEALTEMITEILMQPEKLEPYRHNLRNYKADNQAAIRQFENLIRI